MVEPLSWWILDAAVDRRRRMRNMAAWRRHWAGGWVAGSSQPCRERIDPRSSGWTLEHSDRLLTYGQVAALETCPSSTHRYYTDQYKLAASAPAANGAQNALYSCTTAASFRRHSLGRPVSQSLGGANVDIHRKCHGGRRCHVTTESQRYFSSRLN